ncbi:putative reverse transcriptase domain-containing protein, partial [Tanacetum coccineum]
YECGRLGYYRKDCLKLRNQNRGNKTGNTEATAKACAIGGGELTPIPTLSRCLARCHPFDIDLMPIEHGSFNVITGMDWLAKYHVVIVCDKKIVRIPYGDKVLRQ